jgi:hypothetical protein
LNSNEPAASQTRTTRRPLFVWVIFLFYAYWLVSAARGYQRGYFTLSNGRHIPAPTSRAEQAIRGSILFLEFIAALELLRMREAAIPLYTAAWIAHAMLTTYDIASARAGRHFFAVTSIALIAFAAFTAVVAYVFRLHRQRQFQSGV